MEMKPKILVVDDNFSNILVVEGILESLNVEFVRAFSGEEALQKVEQHEFALVLMDVQMPDIDGFKTAEIIRQDPNKELLPIIFISAIYNRNYYHQKGLGSGAVDFITKPLVPQVFLGKVRVFLKIYTQRKSLECKVEEINKSKVTLTNILNNIDANIYVSDMDTHRILFANESMKQLFGEDMVGKHCWDVLQNKEGVCSSCNNNALLDENGCSSGAVMSNRINAQNGHSYSIFDSAVKWTDGRMVRLEVSFDIQHRLNTEQALQHSKDNFWELFNNSPDAIYVESKEGIIIDLNPAACRLQKFERDELVGKSIFELVPNDRIEIAQKDFPKWFTGETSNVESQLLTSEDTTVPVEIHGSVIQYNGNEAVMLIVRDITERTRAHNDLLESESRFRTLFEKIPTMAVQGIDRGRRVIYWNSASEQFYGYSMSQALGMEYENLILEDEWKEQISQSLDRWFLNEEVIDPHELKFKHKDGRVVHVLASYVKLQNINKETEIYCIQVDLQERDRAQDLQKNRLELIEFISRISSDFINIDVRDIDSTIAKAVDAVSNFTQVGHGFVYLLSNNKELFELEHAYKANGDKDIDAEIEINKYPELIKLVNDEKVKPIIEIFPVHGKIQCYFKLAMAEMGIHSYVTIPMEVGLEFVGFIGFGTVEPNMKWDEEALHAFKLIAQVLTNALERKTADEKVIKALEKATESDRLKTAFLANMSHEIRTPMNAIIGFSGLLSDPELSQEERMQFVNHINSNGNSLLTLINEILDIAKLEAGKIKIKKSRCFINNILKELFDVYENDKIEKEKSHLQFILNIPVEDEYFTISTDPIRFRQIMTNLIGNSLKYTDKGQIEFGFHLKKENLITFFVRDTGIGIPEDKQTYIFDRFRQVDESHTRGFGGTGLGLTISKNLVNLLGGEIWLESKQEQGSTFFFTLPYESKKKENGKRKSMLPGMQKYYWPDKTILVVEDVQTNFEFIEALLKRTDVDILWAKDGVEAIDLFSSSDTIDLVLMDIQMPRMNGYEATGEIKKLKTEVPVIAQTAYAMAEDRQKIFQAGCDDYISKPIKSDLLYSLISKYF